MITERESMEAGKRAAGFKPHVMSDPRPPEVEAALAHRPRKRREARAIADVGTPQRRRYGAGF